MMTGKDKDTHTHVHADTHTHRHTDIQTGRQAGRQGDRQVGRSQKDCWVFLSLVIWSTVLWLQPHFMNLCIGILPLHACKDLHTCKYSLLNSRLKISYSIKLTPLTRLYHFLIDTTHHLGESTSLSQIYVIQFLIDCFMFLKEKRPTRQIDKWLISFRLILHNSSVNRFNIIFPSIMLK